MKFILPLDRIQDHDLPLVGGKALALARMARNELNIPGGLCITTHAYDTYVTSTGLRERILLELNRKPFADMRWEEMWDAALRIRNMFLKTAIPGPLDDALRDAVENRFQDKPVVIRSSSPAEDSARASFAGLHDSFVNVMGLDAILEHIRLVWASLWSDRALLYRQELKLEVEHSTMAVVVQEIVVGERSGVVFGKSPTDDTQAIIESVYGLNQGLVDGTVEPDRWVLDRKTGNLITHNPATREKAMMPSPGGVQLQILPPAKQNAPPLNDEETHLVWQLARRAENLFGRPQDVEWTLAEGVLFALQSRPITSVSTRDCADQRLWYLSLTRSFENLKSLRKRIEVELLPAMDSEANRLDQQDVTGLSDSQLAQEISRRAAIYQKWKDIYWADFIPFAHGARLFGQVYNDTVKPDDPYEFMFLLGGTRMESLRRNRALEDMAAMIRENPQLAEDGNKRHPPTRNKRFDKALEEFLNRFSLLPLGGAEGRPVLLRVLLQMASRPSPRQPFTPPDAETLAARFLASFEGQKRDFAAELLDLARASFRLRDDDNIHLGRIEAQLIAAVQEGNRRVEARGQPPSADANTRELRKALEESGYSPAPIQDVASSKTDFEIRPRQLIGQPAGPGMASGKARVVHSASELHEMTNGEILVCDAVDPNMTFVVPLSAGIVERRGGMLIHGAIIAREYGLPCVTGVPNATSLIRTGVRVTVDGYLGIVTVAAAPEQ